MFKDYKKYLETSIKVYLFVLIIIFILKIVGLDYFGISIDSPFILKINEICSKYHLTDIWYLFSLLFYAYIIFSISLNDQKCFIFTLCVAPIIFFAQHSKQLINITALSSIIDFLYLYFLVLILSFIKKRKDYKGITKRFIIYNIVSIIIQLISYMTRFKYSINYNFGFIENFLLNLDYFIMTIIIYHLYFSKGGIKCYQTEVSLSSLKKINLKKSLQKLQKNLQNSREAFKKQSKQEKLTIIIFTILSLIWNTLSVLVVLVVAKLNHTLIECIFILTSFWLSKKSFGKPFHFDSMVICFIVSNLTYYFLNRVTTPLGISIIIPILLGVGLSYVTSKFVKKTYKPLYRGMPKDLFEETILQVTEKDSDKYKICYEFYIDKKSDLSLSYKYNYSVSGIRKIKDRINEKIKRL